MTTSSVSPFAAIDAYNEQQRLVQPQASEFNEHVVVWYCETQLPQQHDPLPLIEVEYLDACPITVNFLHSVFVDEVSTLLDAVFGMERPFIAVSAAG